MPHYYPFTQHTAEDNPTQMPENDTHPRPSHIIMWAVNAIWHLWEQQRRFTQSGLWGWTPALRFKVLWSQQTKFWSADLIRHWNMERHSFPPLIGLCELPLLLPQVQNCHGCPHIWRHKSTSYGPYQHHARKLGLWMDVLGTLTNKKKRLTEE